MAFGGLFRGLRSVHYSVLSVLVLEHFKCLMYHNVRYSGEKKTHPTPALIDWENKKPEHKAALPNYKKKSRGTIFEKTNISKSIKK